jgi:hypothetical protein
MCGVDCVQLSGHGARRCGQLQGNEKSGGKETVVSHFSGPFGKGIGREVMNLLHIFAALGQQLGKACSMRDLQCKP